MSTPEIEIPSHLTYAENHAWIAEDSKVCTVSISSNAKSMLGDMVFVVLRLRIPRSGPAFWAGHRRKPHENRH